MREQHPIQLALWALWLLLGTTILGCNKPSPLGEQCNSYRGCSEGVCTLLSIRYEKPIRLCTVPCKSDTGCEKPGFVCIYIENTAQPLTHGYCLLPKGSEPGAACELGSECDHGVCLGAKGRCASGERGCICSKLCLKNDECPNKGLCQATRSGFKACRPHVGPAPKTTPKPTTAPAPKPKTTTSPAPKPKTTTSPAPKPKTTPTPKPTTAPTPKTAPTPEPKR